MMLRNLCEMKRTKQTKKTNKLSILICLSFHEQWHRNCTLQNKLVKFHLQLRPPPRMIIFPNAPVCVWNKLMETKLGKLPWSPRSAVHVIGKTMPTCIAPCFDNPKLQEPQNQWITSYSRWLLGDVIFSTVFFPGHVGIPLWSLQRVLTLPLSHLCFFCTIRSCQDLHRKQFGI